MVEGPENRYRQAFGFDHPRILDMKNFRIRGDQRKSSLSPAQQEAYRCIENAKRLERERDEAYRKAFYTGFQEPARQAPAKKAQALYEKSYPRQPTAQNELDQAASLKRTFLEAAARTNSPAHRFHLHEQCTVASPERPSRFYRGDGTGTYDLAGMIRMPYRDINEKDQQPQRLKRRDNDTLDRCRSPEHRKGYHYNLLHSDPRQSDGPETDIDAEIDRIEKSIQYVTDQLYIAKRLQQEQEAKRPRLYERASQPMRVDERDAAPHPMYAMMANGNKRPREDDDEDESSTKSKLPPVDLKDLAGWKRNCFTALGAMSTKLSDYNQILYTDEPVIPEALIRSHLHDGQHPEEPDLAQACRLYGRTMDALGHPHDLATPMYKEFVQERSSYRTTNTRIFYMVLKACHKEVDINEHIHTLLEATPPNERLILDGKALFDVILTFFTRDTTQERGFKLKQLYASRLKSSETGYDFIIKSEKKARELIALGVPLDFSTTLTTLVQSNFIADRRYKSIGEQLFLRAETDHLFDWDKVKNTVRVFDINMRSQILQESSSSSQALQTLTSPRHSDSNRQPGSYRKTPRYHNKSLQRPACQHCGKFHSGACRYKPTSSAPTSSPSPYMRQPKGASPSIKPSSGKSSYQPSSKAPFKCFRCGGPHSKKNCPQEIGHSFQASTEILDISAIIDNGASQSGSAFMLADTGVSDTESVFVDPFLLSAAAASSNFKTLHPNALRKRKSEDISTSPNQPSSPLSPVAPSYSAYSPISSPVSPMTPRVIIPRPADLDDDYDDVPDLIDDNDSSPPSSPRPPFLSSKQRIVATGNFVDDLFFSPADDEDDDDDEYDGDADDDSDSQNSFDLYVADFYEQIQPAVTSYFHIDSIERLYDPQYPDFANYINQSLVCALNRSNGDMFCTKCRCGLRGHFCEVMMKAGSGIDQLQAQDRDPDVAPPVTTSSKLKILFCYMSTNKLI